MGSTGEFESTADKAMEWAISSARWAASELMNGDLSQASVLQEQSRIWMELHDRMLVAEAQSALNSAFALPTLGVASTEELLLELEMRGRVHFTGTGLSSAAQELLDGLPGEILEYRAVDE
jgi:hypothetical protein